MDKEQIIIDIDRCKYRDEYTNFCLAEKDDIGKTYTICTGTDCYYKQLARKTQEYERLKKNYFKQNEWLQQRAKECEALKSESFTREELIDIQEKDIDRYRKALEEIEGYIKDPCEYCKPTSKCRECLGEGILNIINKAKGEGNE